MSESKTPILIAEADHRAPRVKTGAAKPAAAVPKNTDKTSGRHAAITKNLNNWGNYKNWVEKHRGTWQEKK